MTDPTPDPTLDRVLRHMAWANAELFGRLETLDDTALGFASPRNEWTVAMILDHLVIAAARYAARLESVQRPEDTVPPAAIAELPGLAAACAAFDARIRAQATLPDVLVGHPSFPSGPRARSTVIGQAIHHATEHRAQIAAALATNGVDVIDLDALDVWAYGEAEGLGA